MRSVIPGNGWVNKRGQCPRSLSSTLLTVATLHRIADTRHSAAKRAHDRVCQLIVCAPGRIKGCRRALLSEGLQFFQ